MKQAQKLGDEANDLSGRVATTQTRLKQLEDQAEIDSQQAKDAKDRLGHAKVIVNDFSDQVNRVMDSVRVILSELDDLTDIGTHSKSYFPKI